MFSPIFRLQLRAALVGAGWALVASGLSLLLIIVKYVESLLSVVPTFNWSDYVLGGALLIFAGTRLVGISVDYFSSDRKSPTSKLDRVLFGWVPIGGWIIAIAFVVFLTSKPLAELRIDRVSIIVYWMVGFSIAYSAFMKSLSFLRRLRTSR